MAAKLALVFIAAFVFCQFISWGVASPRVERETATTQDASKTIDDALNSLNTGVNELLASIKGNAIFQNVTTALEQFGESVKAQGKQLVEKIQKAAD